MFRPFSEYFKHTSDPSGLRKFIRVPVSLPVLYSFNTEQKGKHELREALSIDVSATGIALEIIGLPKRLQKHFFEIRAPVHLQIKLPGHDNLIEISGQIQWCKIHRLGDPAIYRAGIQFVEGALDERARLLLFGLRTARMNRLKKVSRIVVPVLLSVFLIWAVFAAQKADFFRQRAGEFWMDKQKLEQEVNELLDSRKELEAQLEQKDREIDIKLQALAVFKTNIIEIQQEAETTEYILITRNLEKGRYKKALKQAEVFVQENPDSIAAFSLLFRALKESGREDEADRLFTEFSLRLLEQVDFK